MSSVDRQNKLIASEDWKRIYQSFKNADFQSYDFDNLRRTMITYLRENYPEDFNDYIESSEYLALIDLIAFLGQNLAYRFDLNARDNFLELSERKESVLRLARLLSYNPKRTQTANGLLKFTAVNTTETILDSNGRNISGQTVIWNDSANINWYEQFIKVLNAALPTSGQFGKPQDSAVIQGISTQQYRLNSSNADLPIYNFTKNIDGRNVDFEIVSTAFKGQDTIYEEPPYPGNSLSFVYRDDGSGPPSSNTGFFLHFRQGTLQEGNFTVARPSSNETVDLDAPNINNSDIWLYDLDSANLLNELWTKVDAVEGNNVIYNSLSKDIKKIYSAITRTGDRVRLVFSDGVFGTLPQGNFKVYYRISNGLSYSITPTTIKNVSISVPYTSKIGKQETLTLTLSLKYTVDNASEAESSDSIKLNAPATYYSQNRMITGEDYNILPLNISQEIVKVKAINRVSSGVSRYFDLKDTTGKYSNTNLFGTDGILYKEATFNSFKFNYQTRTDIEDAVLNKIEPILSSKLVKNFYLDAYPFVSLSVAFSKFTQVTSATNMSSGFFKDIDDSVGTIKKLGASTFSNLRFIVPGSMVKFTPPPGFLFDVNNILVPVATASVTARDFIWTKIVQVTSDGTARNTGILASGLGPVVLNDIVPTNALADTVVPKFVTALDASVRNKVIDLIFSSKNFALRYDSDAVAWKIITESNIDKKSAFNLGKTGDSSNQQLDSSWIILLETDGETYTVTYRGLRHVFESQREIRFFFDSSDKVYDPVEGRIIKDKISVLSINTMPDMITPFNQSFDWEIVDEYQGADGYVDTKKISISFYDSDEDGVVDDPELFKKIVSPEVNTSEKFIFQRRLTGLDGVLDYYYIENTNNLIKIYLTQEVVPTTSLADGQIIYLIRENILKRFNKSSTTFTVANEYRAFYGRSGLKFQYIHAADSNARIDPASTNIIDVYLLTKTYDTNHRRWLKGEIITQPLPLSSDALYINFGNQLNKVKSISDEIIYHPAKYKALFGNGADSSLQATFKIVKNSNVIVSDNDIKSSVVTAIDEFFAIENWDFGDKFYFTELSTYIMQQLSPNIVNIIIVPKKQDLVFGSLFEISSNSDEIFVSSATVDDVEIISEITAAKINTTGQVLTSYPSSTYSITSN
jgi:hypothetical protein